MSNVSNYLLLPSLRDVITVNSLNEELKRIIDTRQEFIRIESCGGSKHLELPVFSLAGNYVLLGVVLCSVRNVSWEAPSQLTLLYGGQEDECFRKIDIWKT